MLALKSAVVGHFRARMIRCSHQEAFRTRERCPLAASPQEVEQCSTFIADARCSLTIFFLSANHALFLVTWQNMLNNVVYLTAHMFPGSDIYDQKATFLAVQV